MSVVGSDEDQSVFKLANLLEVLNGGSDSVVKLEQITKGSVDILDMHFLIDELDVSFVLIQYVI
jgi:hypothetical protein